MLRVIICGFEHEGRLSCKIKTSFNCYSDSFLLFCFERSFIFFFSTNLCVNQKRDSLIMICHFLCFCVLSFYLGVLSITVSHAGALLKSLFKRSLKTCILQLCHF